MSATSGKGCPNQAATISGANTMANRMIGAAVTFMYLVVENANSVVRTRSATPRDDAAGIRAEKAVDATPASCPLTLDANS